MCFFGTRHEIPITLYRNSTASFSFSAPKISFHSEAVHISHHSSAIFSLKVAGNVESFNIISQTGFFSPDLLIK